MTDLLILSCLGIGVVVGSAVTIITTSILNEDKFKKYEREISRQQKFIKTQKKMIDVQQQVIRMERNRVTAWVATSEDAPKCDLFKSF